VKVKNTFQTNSHRFTDNENTADLAEWKLSL